MVALGKGAGRKGGTPNSEDRKSKTYTKEERWATGKGWCAGGKGSIQPKKKSQLISPEEYKKILADEEKEKLRSQRAQEEIDDVEREVSVCDTITEKLKDFDWNYFLNKSKHPTILKYLEYGCEDPVDFSKDEGCVSIAHELEAFLESKKKLKQRYADLLKTKKSLGAAKVSKAFANHCSRMKNLERHIVEWTCALDDAMVCYIRQSRYKAGWEMISGTGKSHTQPPEFSENNSKTKCRNSSGLFSGVKVKRGEEEKHYYKSVAHRCSKKELRAPAENEDYIEFLAQQNKMKEKNVELVMHQTWWDRATVVTALKKYDYDAVEAIKSLMRSL